MNYLDCKKLIDDNGIELSITMEIALCVSASLCGIENVSDDMYVAICNYVRHVWDKVDKTYTQLISDVVIDCIYHCFEYYQCNDITLSYDDVKSLAHFDDVRDIYLQKYFD